MHTTLWAVGLALIGLAGLAHVGIFVLESVAWDRFGHRVFGVPADESAVVRPWAMNQGWYNLFLGLGALGGAIASLIAWYEVLAVAGSVAAFSALCMVGAAVVLVATNRRMLRGALIQGLLPLLGLTAIGIAALG